MQKRLAAHGIALDELLNNNNRSFKDQVGEEEEEEKLIQMGDFELKINYD